MVFIDLISMSDELVLLIFITKGKSEKCLIRSQMTAIQDKTHPWVFKKLKRVSLINQVNMINMIPTNYIILFNEKNVYNE